MEGSHAPCFSFVSSLQLNCPSSMTHDTRHEGRRACCHFTTHQPGLFDRRWHAHGRVCRVADGDQVRICTSRRPPRADGEVAVVAAHQGHPLHSPRTLLVHPPPHRHPILAVCVMCVVADSSHTPSLSVCVRGPPRRSGSRSGTRRRSSWRSRGLRSAPA